MVYKWIVLIQFLRKKCLLWKNNENRLKDCAKKISRTQTLLKIMGCEKSMKCHQKRKKKV